MKIGFLEHFSTSLTKKQVQDAGMAVVLMLLLTGLFTKAEVFYKISLGALLVTMIFPMFFYPFAIFWFGFSGLLGALMSKLILLIIYLLFVVPVAFVRNIGRKDNLLLKSFKKSSKSVMKSRNHIFVASDLDRPF